MLVNYDHILHLKNTINAVPLTPRSVLPGEGTSEDLVRVNRSKQQLLLVCAPITLAALVLLHVAGNNLFSIKESGSADTIIGDGSDLIVRTLTPVFRRDKYYDLNCSRTFESAFSTFALKARGGCTFIVSLNSVIQTSVRLDATTSILSTKPP
jgi:hypothetical protein